MTRDDEVDAAEAEAELILEANAAVFGDDVTETPASTRENVIAMLRITGPGKARQCGHLAGPTVVYLHPATRVHQCQECYSLPESRRAMDTYRPGSCDSCGEKASRYWPAQFTVMNILVTGYFCDDCREGRRAAVLPEWTRRLGRDDE